MAADEQERFAFVIRSDLPDEGLVRLDEFAVIEVFAKLVVCPEVDEDQIQDEPAYTPRRSFSGEMFSKNSSMLIVSGHSVKLVKGIPRWAKTLISMLDRNKKRVA